MERGTKRCRESCRVEGVLNEMSAEVVPADVTGAQPAADSAVPVAWATSLLQPSRSIRKERRRYREREREREICRVEGVLNEMSAEAMSAGVAGAQNAADSGVPVVRVLPLLLVMRDWIGEERSIETGARWVGGGLNEMLAKAAPAGATGAQDTAADGAPAARVLPLLPAKRNGFMEREGDKEIEG